MKKKKGFTLVELLAVIVILAVIVLIAVPSILNVIDKTKKGAAESSALGYIDAIEKRVMLDKLEGIEHIDKEDYVYDEIEVNLKGSSPNGGLYSLEKNMVINATFCIDGYKVVYNKDSVDKKVKAIEKCTEENIKLESKLVMEKSSTNIIYPATDDIGIIENLSGGKITCETNDESIATCEVNDNLVTIKSGKKEGHTSITIKSETTKKYQEAQAVIEAITIKGNLLNSINANGYDGNYDGEEHTITVSSTGSIITYKDEEGNYSLSESPKYIDAGEYTVYYKVVKEGYNDFTDSKKVIINKAVGSIVLESSSGILKYGEQKEIEVTENLSGGELSISSSSDVASATVENNKIIITATKVGETSIIVTSGEGKNHKRASTTYKLKVVKADNVLSLEKESTVLTYPDEEIINVIENKSEGTLSCEPENASIATCEIVGNTLKVKTGTTKGTTTITVKSRETSNYNEGVYAFFVTTNSGSLVNSISANGYSGSYDGAAHGISVTSSGATIKYGTSEGTYDLNSSPTRTDAGTTRVYYEVSKAGYETVTGSKDIVISKINGSASISTTSVSVRKDSTSTVTLSNYTGSIGSPTSSNTGVATVSLSGSTITIRGVNAGSATITIPINASTNYNATSKTVTVSNWCSYTKGQTWNYGSTGGIQSFTAPCSGSYRLEVWGAQGSNGSGSSGGAGGYSSGYTNLNASNTIYIGVGGYTGNENGGYNGGGYGNGRNDGGYPDCSGGGGGATHITSTNRGVLSNYNSYRGEIYIVAGGGGGGGELKSGLTVPHGGSGGGTAGGTGASVGGGGGGTQSGSQNLSAGGDGYFGHGGNANPLYATETGRYYAGGGGGGYFGGEGGDWWQELSNRSGAGGGGGSGYIGGVSSGYTSNGAQPGNGYARITLNS